MKISIITPVFNSSKTIEYCAKSIILQTYKNYEHIIVDKFSSDNSLTKVKEAYEKAGLSDRLKIIQENDEGISDAFNIGIKNSTGEIITILNSDDHYMENTLFDDVIKCFWKKNIDIVYGDIYFEDDFYGSNVRSPLPMKYMRGVNFNHPALFLRNSVYDQIGIFDKAYKLSMDADLFHRINQKYDVGYQGYYFNKYPMVLMRAGGASYKNELLSINEIIKSLKKYNLYNLKARLYLHARKDRYYLKRILTSIGLQKVVSIWRRLKWKN